LAQDTHDLADWLARLVSDGRAPGIAVSVRRGDEETNFSAGVHTARRPGDIGPDTRFPMGCMAKSLMALLCAELHLQGRIDVDRPVSDFLPEFRLGRTERPVTIAQILSHATGFVEPQDQAVFQNLTWDDFVDFFNSRIQAFAPGAVWSYTQSAHSIVSRILSRACGAPAIKLIKDQILDALSLGPTDIDSRERNLRSCASLHVRSQATRRFEPIRLPADSGFFRESISDIPLSVSELIRLVRGLEARKQAIALVRERVRSICPLSSTPWAEATPSQYGLGVGLFGDYWAMTGSYLGSTCAIRHRPEAGLTIAIGMNAWAPGVRDAILERLMSASGGYEAPKAAVRLAPDPSLWPGVYQGLTLNAAVLTVERDGDKFDCRLKGHNGEIRVSLQPDDGLCRIVRRSAPVSIGFYDAPASGGVYARVGAVAYRKITP
jgi:CubicO group peptidase (beta-lactamase class C family)